MLILVIYTILSFYFFVTGSYTYLALAFLFSPLLAVIDLIFLASLNKHLFKPFKEDLWAFSWSVVIFFSFCFFFFSSACIVICFAPLFIFVAVYASFGFGPAFYSSLIFFSPLFWFWKEKFTIVKFFFFPFCTLKQRVSLLMCFIFVWAFLFMQIRSLGPVAISGLFDCISTRVQAEEVDIIPASRKYSAVSPVSHVVRAAYTRPWSGIFVEEFGAPCKIPDSLAARSTVWGISFTESFDFSMFEIYPRLVRVRTPNPLLSGTPLFLEDSGNPTKTLPILDRLRDLDSYREFDVAVLKRYSSNHPVTTDVAFLLPPKEVLLNTCVKDPNYFPNFENCSSTPPQNSPECDDSEEFTDKPLPSLNFAESAYLTDMSDKEEGGSTRSPSWSDYEAGLSEGDDGKSEKKDLFFVHSDLYSHPADELFRRVQDTALNIDSSAYYIFFTDSTPHDAIYNIDNLSLSSLERQVMALRVETEVDGPIYWEDLLESLVNCTNAFGCSEERNNHDPHFLFWCALAEGSVTADALLTHLRINPDLSDVICEIFVHNYLCIAIVDEISGLQSL